MVSLLMRESSGKPKTFCPIGKDRTKRRRNTIWWKKSPSFRQLSEIGVQLAQNNENVQQPRALIYVSVALKDDIPAGAHPSVTELRRIYVARADGSQLK